MSERMLIEALIEHLGLRNFLQLLEIVCDAKAAEMVAYGDMKAARDWAQLATKITCETAH